MRGVEANVSDRGLVVLTAMSGVAWGLAEASFFFVVPDVLISAFALRGGRLALFALAGSLFGACVGGAAMYLWAQHDPATAWAMVDAVPFVPERLFAVARELSATHQGLGILIGSFSGVPYKIFAVQAPEAMSFASFLAWTLPGRATRFAMSATLAWWMARWLRTRSRSDWVRLGWAAVWVGIYAGYWTEMSQ